MKDARILVVEDDPTMQRVLKDNLEFCGYKVSVASDGKNGWQAIREGRPDLIVLDVMLPHINGFDLCRRVRREGMSIPIIMLTAKGQETDVVLGLNLGADDYVTKPFSVDVLLARVNARLRQQDETSSQKVKFGHCEVDFCSHRLLREGREIPLTPKEFGLLQCLIQHKGRALTRTQILDRVWGQDLIVTERSVDRCINTLRNKIEPDPQHPQFLQTVRDVGYRFDSKGRS